MAFSSISCRSTAAVSVCLALAGCASLPMPDDRIAAQPQRGPVCDSAVGSATTIDATLARDYAQRAVLLQAGELRGELLDAGLRKVHLAGESTQCGPYALTGADSGLVTCTTQLRLCGQ